MHTFPTVRLNVVCLFFEDFLLFLFHSIIISLSLSVFVFACCLFSSSSSPPLLVAFKALLICLTLFSICYLFVLIVVGLRVVFFKSQFLLTRLLCRGEYSLGCGNENNRRCWKNLFLLIGCFKQIFHRRATEKIGWVWYVWSECVCWWVVLLFVCLFAIQRRGRKSETRWKPLEIELVWLLLLLLLLLLHNLECYRTIGTEKEERIEENPVW